MRTRRHASRTGGLVIAVLSVAASLPSMASAAPARPDATTDPATSVTQTSARLNGSVVPNERTTNVYFQYGTTRAYEARTPPIAVGNGNRRVAVSADVSGLGPATRYYFRLVAVNVRGTTRAAGRRFRTQRQPLGLTLTATRNPVRPGGSTVITGTLAGTGNAGRQVVLLANPFPFTQGFLPATDPHVTGPQGQFSFPILSVPVNTQYSVRLPGAPNVASPIVTVGVAVRVGVNVRVRRARRAMTVRLRGKIRPAHHGALVAIQRLRRGGNWVTIDGTVARRGGRTFSRYSETVTLGRSARLRVLAEIRDGDHVAAYSRVIRVRR